MKFGSPTCIRSGWGELFYCTAPHRTCVPALAFLHLRSRTCVPAHAQIALAFPHMRSTCVALAQLHSDTGTNLTRVQETQVRKRKCGNACAVGCSAVKRLSPAAPVAPRAPKFHLAPNPVQAMPILELTFYAPRQNLEKNGLNLNTPAPGASVE